MFIFIFSFAFRAWIYWIKQQLAWKAMFWYWFAHRCSITINHIDSHIEQQSNLNSYIGKYFMILTKIVYIDSPMQATIALKTKKIGLSSKDKRTIAKLD